MRRLAAAGGALAFVALATLNSGGYRYGASDQAFYIPAILKQLDPALYPRDTALVAPQARYFFVDEIVAAVVQATDWSLETCFAAGYVVGLMVFYAALWRLGHLVFRHSLATWALLAAETLRHRITKTGVNTLEGYFHPRVLVFAIGVWALTLYLRGRPWAALAAVLIAGLLHPTTAAFFVLFLSAAIWTTEPPARRAIGALVTIGLVALAWLQLAGPMRGSLWPMDPEWRGLLASKDYLFPVPDWTAGAWLANLGTAALAIGGIALRIRSGIASPRERGLLAGSMVLLLGFVVTLPAVWMGSAFIVQLQISRVFWLLDLLATVVLIGVLVDSPRGRPLRRWQLAIAVLLVALSLGRGAWVAFVEHADRSVWSQRLPEDDWTRVLRWASAQPATVHLLADPGHAWRYGAPLRFAGRDVFLEEVKDTAMAAYSRDAAQRVLERTRALGDFSTLDSATARALALRFGIDYLVLDRELDLPRAHQEGPFHIYAVR